MIYGDGVGGKYSVIIAGRCQELYAGISYADRITKHDDISQFIGMVRDCDMQQFNQWYDLYKDIPIQKELHDRRRTTKVT